MPVAGSRTESMSGLLKFREFKSRSEASIAAAELLANLLRDGLAKDSKAQASLVVSGGSTPGPCFDQLSRQVLDWSRVTVLPSDERWVPGNDLDSNERLIRSRLLQGSAGQGNVLPFFRQGIEAKQAPRVIEQDLERLARPFNASLLGMGEDGHFASLFPDFAGLPEALDPRGKAKCIMVQTAGSPHLRISLTLSALLDSACTVLLIFGEKKRAVFDAAIDGGSDYPIESLLKNISTPLTVIWAP
jgi:6-phosphogluconolactonase